MFVLCYVLLLSVFAALIHIANSLDKMCCHVLCAASLNVRWSAVYLHHAHHGQIGTVCSALTRLAVSLTGVSGL
jgi:hypothetical protein